MTSDLLRPDASPAALAALSVGEAVAVGFDGLEIWCPGCRGVLLPFRLLLARGHVRGQDALLALPGRLRCGRCGRAARPEEVLLWCQTDCTAKPRITRPTLAACAAARAAAAARPEGRAGA